MKTFYKLLVFLFLNANCQIFSQPNLNYKITTLDTIYGNGVGFLEQFQNLGRFNLLTMNAEEYLTEYIVQYIDIIWDPTENFAIINLEEKENIIFDLLSNQVIDNQILDWHNLVKVLYSPTYNNLYIFSEDYSQELPIIISVYNLNTKQIINTTGVSAHAGSKNFLCYPKPDIFFSSDGEYIYISTNDTSTFSTQLWTFSLEINSVISKVNLSEFGYPNMFGYSLSFGSGGKGIICSYNEYDAPIRHLYYNIYDFDNNTSTGFIHKNYVDNECYFTNKGKYLLFISSVWGDTSDPNHHTGYTEIYDTENCQLLKNINLPPRGIIYTFDNYPNNLYYTIDIELPTRQIYTLKMDSILNVLDLTSLSPATKIVNSAPFTLTVNGHGFDTLSTVYFNDSAKTTTYVNDSVLTASISTSDISVVGNYPVWVTDEWGTSDTLMFTVTLQPADLSSLSPAIALTYDPLYDLEYFTITVSGSNFDSSSVIYFGGYARTTTFVSSTVLTFQGRSYDVGVNAHTIPLWVSNGGAISDTLIFSVQTNNALIEPVFSCIVEKGEDEFTAHLGYINSNSAAVFIPIGSKNQFWPSPQDRGQPKIFLPGSNLESFTIDFDGSEISWQFATSEATFSGKSDQCE